MTPYEIGVLLHYYSHVGDHPDIARNPPIWSVTMNQFVANDLLHDRGTDCCYGMTKRGYAYVESLQRVPPPVAVTRWVTEWPE